MKLEEIREVIINNREDIAARIILERMAPGGSDPDPGSAGRVADEEAGGGAEKERSDAQSRAAVPPGEAEAGQQVTLTLKDSDDGMLTLSLDFVPDVDLEDDNESAAVRAACVAVEAIQAGVR